MAIYIGIVATLGYMFVQLPSAFLPNEDQGFILANVHQGFILANVQTPAEASSNRTFEVVQALEDYVGKENSVDKIVAINGYTFNGVGQNAALAFITLKDWSERDEANSAQSISQRITIAMSSVRDAIVFALSSSPIQGLGNSNGFSFRLQDRGGLGPEALRAGQAQFLAEAANSKILTGVNVEGMPDAAQVSLVIDREKANTFGVAFSDINSTITTALGSAYINDFPNSGRMQRVMVQADNEKRMQTADLLKLHVRNANGGMVPLSSFAKIEWTRGSSQAVGYNGYPAVRISGQSAPGYSSGDAIAEVERIAKNLPAGFGYEWSGQSLQEIQSGSQMPMLLALSCILIFLCLAALYESWSIPISVMLVIPLGIIGSVAAVMLRDMSNDVYFKVGLITIIGLSAKNAILIIEFAKDLRAQGKPLPEATVEAAHLRFRPILMTSLAFTLGVLPLAIAAGASAAS